MEELRPGAYGCVYRPAFRCKEPPVYPDEKYISKVMRKKTAKKELSNYRALNMRAIDANRQYYLGEPELCTLENPESFTITKKKCKINAPIAVLNYIDGGDNLITVLKRPRVNYVFLLKAFENIFHAIVLMHANERYHLDIKLGNIVFDGKSCRLVDFGLSRTSGMKLSNIYLYGFLPPHYVYPYWPVEMSQLTNRPPALNLDLFNDYYDAMSSINYLIRRIPLKAIEGIQPALNELSLPARKKFIYERADVWAIGIALYDIYHLLPATQSELKGQLQDYITFLLRVSIFDRPNALDALTAYQTFLSGIDDKIRRV